jgi:hypothetical protein
MLSGDPEVRILVDELVPKLPDVTPLGETIKAVDGWGKDYPSLDVLRANAFEGALAFCNFLRHRHERYGCGSTEEFILGYTPIGDLPQMDAIDLKVWYDCIGGSFRLAPSVPANHELTPPDADVFQKGFAALFWKAAHLVVPRDKKWALIKSLEAKT